jgi:hypothetical protein
LLRHEEAAEARESFLFVGCETAFPGRTSIVICRQVLSDAGECDVHAFPVKTIDVGEVKAVGESINGADSSSEPNPLRPQRAAFDLRTSLVQVSFPAVEYGHASVETNGRVITKSVQLQVV